MRAVLVLQHVPYEGQGYIADYMQDHAIDSDVLRLWESYALPDVSSVPASGLCIPEWLWSSFPLGVHTHHGPGTRRGQSRMGARGFQSRRRPAQSGSPGARATPESTMLQTSGQLLQLIHAVQRS